MDKATLLQEIKKRLAGHDFCGEILDDAWSEVMTQKALNYLTKDEFDALGDDLGDGVQVVLDEFIRWLTRD